MLRPGSAGSNTAADHLAVLDARITALPPGFRRRLMATCDGAGASHALITRLDELAAWRGYQVTYSVSWELGARVKAAIAAVPDAARQIAVDARGEVRERRADAACGDLGCGHRRCWIEEAHVTELTSLLREGLGRGRTGRLARGDAPVRLPGAPAPRRVVDLVRGRRRLAYTLWVTNLPPHARGWRGQNAYINAAHRVHARVEEGFAPARTATSASTRPPRWR
jgi:hypothetical protein